MSSALTFALFTLLFSLLIDAQTCSPGSPCEIGCCSTDGGFCGYGPDYCAADKCNAALSANGTCHQLSECDPGFNPGWGPSWGSTYAGSQLCPLNVCCSQFGFCTPGGTTEEFCGTSTVTQPSCSGSSASQRTLGYYEGWAPTRPCDAMTPEEIPIGAYTHLVYGFVSIDPNTFAVVAEAPEEQQLMSRFTALKTLKPSLETWMSIGGWSFTDPGPTQATFSTLVGSSTAQSAFFSSLSSFMSQYGFDGVDIDWEYPTTPDRDGSPADYANLPTFMANLKSHLSSHGYGLSMTLPSSYWYLRGFDIVSLEASVDWFNVMTYDLHGTWDAIDPWIGNIMLAHTNLTEIRETMDLLWRNNISPSKVNLGIGFYGRSFTATNPSCVYAGCPFSGGGFAGRCTQDVGTLSYTEIERVIAAGGANILFDQEAAVKIVTWNSNQWVSYDDAQTLALKLQYANSECLGGTMVWAVSLDMDGSAAAALSGQGSLFPGSDGSTGNGGDVYFPPSIWGSSGNPVKCEPPCTIILPPSSIQPTVVNWPPITTKITQSGGGTSTTIIPVPAFTISSVSFWPVTIASGVTGGHITPRQSVLPPTPVVIGLPGSQTLVPAASGTYSIVGAPIPTPGDAQPGTVSGCSQWYRTESGDSCSSIADMFGISTTDFVHWNPAVGPNCANGIWLGYNYCVSTSAGAVVGGWQTASFGPNSHSVTIQPMPTFSITGLNPPPTFTFSTGPPNGVTSTSPFVPGATGPGGQEPPGCPGCGSTGCHLFGCGGHCGVFGCDGGCGIGFCGGGCGLVGCGPGCGPGACVIPGGESTSLPSLTLLLHCHLAHLVSH
ncbi:glycoside hydrolase superfamily [Apodospora peruviana]|uniref:chitinase n=1 Tax=Apodospora peruviana TaxID=516989 RepID=A0AAE0M8Z8_9PEZI|nr:glycoside hydrolase superfamily [Apodospora peruviana]